MKIPTEYTLGTIKSHIDIVIEHSDKNRGALAVLITLTLKKIISPKQDIRNHQAKMKDGFSGRGLDEKIVTPFLKEKDFPYMKGGSGWLTRSFEQDQPYRKDYRGGISPPTLKSAFLSAVHEIQSGADSEQVLSYILRQLAERRDKRKDISFDRPTNLHIGDIIQRLNKHFSNKGQGAARLPVLAIYAVYEQLVNEVKKYEDCILEDLRSHTSADAKTKLLGDIQISQEGKPIEAVEIKHGIAITPQTVDDCYKKIKKSTVKTYYLLSTSDKMSPDTWQKISKIVLNIREKHGCQMIVNGLIPSLKYYLRLLKDTNKFIDSYVTLLEKDLDIPYSLKSKWNQ